MGGILDNDLAIMETRGAKTLRGRAEGIEIGKVEEPRADPAPRDGSGIGNSPALQAMGPLAQTTANAIRGRALPYSSPPE